MYQFGTLLLYISFARLAKLPCLSHFPDIRCSSVPSSLGHRMLAAVKLIFSHATAIPLTVEQSVRL